MSLGGAASRSGIRRVDKRAEGSSLAMRSNEDGQVGLRPDGDGRDGFNRHSVETLGAVPFNQVVCSVP